MIHGYHVILPMYGFWLPNDPRGSWSEFVRKWELIRFGKANKTHERQDADQLTDHEREQRAMARETLAYPPVSLNGLQALSIANAFAETARKSNYTFWACSIMPEHTHLVIARHNYNIEQIVNLLKGAATTRITKDKLHPLQAHSAHGIRPPRIWAAGMWKVYLDSEQAIENAIAYVQQNPTKEGMKPQPWSFVTRFTGIIEGGWTTYH